MSKIASLTFAGRLSRDHVFHMTFPEQMKLDDLKNLFSPFGECSWGQQQSLESCFQN